MTAVAKFFKWGITLGIFVALFIVRAHDYDRYPLAGHADELNYGWAGISLIRDGKPFGWSYQPYPKSWIFYDGLIGKKGELQVGGPMVRPWLDEPPLFFLLAGGSAHLFGDETWSVLPASHIRIPSIIFGFATTLVLFFWAKRWFGHGTGLLVATVYTLTPLILFGSRLALPENGLSFLYLTGLFLLSIYLDNPKHSWLLFLVILCGGLAGWMKPTGFALLPLASFWLVIKKHYKAAIVVFLSVLPFIVGYLGYGYYLGGNDFWTILRVQGFRPTGWSGLGFILGTPSWSTETFLDGWYIFLMFTSIATILFKRNNAKVRYLGIGFLFWLMVIVLTAGEQDLLAWYRYPLFPFISFIGTLGLIDFFKEPDLFRGLFSLGTLLSARYYLHNAFIPTTSNQVFKFLFILLAIPFVLGELFENRKGLLYLQRATLGLIVGLGLFLNLKYDYSAFPIRCEAISCPIQVGTKLSELKLPFVWRLLVPGRYNR